MESDVYRFQQLQVRTFRLRGEHVLMGDGQCAIAFETGLQG